MKDRIYRGHAGILIYDPTRKIIYNYTGVITKWSKAAFVDDQDREFKSRKRNSFEIHMK